MSTHNRLARCSVGAAHHIDARRRIFHLAAVEIEVLRDQVVGQDRGAAADQAPAQPGLPVLERLGRPQRGERDQEIGLPRLS